MARNVSDLHQLLDQEQSQPADCHPWTLDTGIPAGMTRFLVLAEDIANQHKPCKTETL